MTTEINREKLDEYNIFGLRDLARTYGHRSPTNKKKEDLIEFILNAINNPVQQNPNELKEAGKPRRGRPPKKTDPVLPSAEPEIEEILIVNSQESTSVPVKTFNESEPQLDKQAEDRTEKSTEVFEVREGVLELCPDGYGFLRAKNYEQGEGDAYVAAPKIRKTGLRKGDYVKAFVKKLAENRPMSVTDVIEVNGLAPEEAFKRPSFENLVPIFPEDRYVLELPSSRNDFAIRAIDLVAPIGKGQRAMIVSPPKAGKTTLLKKVANSITKNYPDAHLMVLLVDERPEEVTDMQRSINGEVVFSTFDEQPEHHTKASELVLERAKRLVELGKDVVILMDSLTRLARAYNLVITPTGKTLSGGIDPGSLYLPKKFFGAARNIENGGSLTIIATALVDTGSRMDDVIYEEFKGTGNMEIHLDRKLSEKRIFPAIDLARSGTRREEKLLNENELQAIFAVRRVLSVGDVQESTEKLIAMMMRTQTNKEFIDLLNAQIKKNRTSSN